MFSQVLKECKMTFCNLTIISSKTGYDGVENFFEELTDLLIEEIKLKDQLLGQKKQHKLAVEAPCGIGQTNGAKAAVGAGGLYDVDSGIDTSDSCDEKKPLSVKKAEAERIRGKHFKQMTSPSINVNSCHHT